MMIKDLKQLQDARSFSFTAVEGLLSVERELEVALRYVPYCDEHRDVWSGHFASIILEAAHQVDSIWVATAKLDDSTIKPDAKLSITDHHNRFSGFVAKQ